MILRNICGIATFALAVTFAGAQVNVTQLHNHYTRDGLYVDPAFTLAAVTNLTLDSNFDGTIPSAKVPAQPLYVEGGPDGRAKVIVAVKTLSTNYLSALDAVTGKTICKLDCKPGPRPKTTSSYGKETPICCVRAWKPFSKPLP